MCWFLSRISRNSFQYFSTIGETLTFSFLCSVNWWSFTYSLCHDLPLSKYIFITGWILSNAYTKRDSSSNFNSYFSIVFIKINSCATYNTTKSNPGQARHIFRRVLDPFYPKFRTSFRQGDSFLVLCIDYFQNEPVDPIKY